MAASEGEISYFARRYWEATGHVPTRFVCPITLLDEPNPRLCDGHILCDKLKSASKLTVLQREDVDNRLGSFVERDFVTFANFRDAKTEDLMRAGKKFTITSPSGETMPAFFAGKEARVRFQQLDMYNENGKTVATPYLTSHILEPGQYKQLEVKWKFYIHKHCFTAAMLKSAYLNLFRLLGYEWVLDVSGDRVRRVLAACVASKDRRAALDQFSDFEGCCWITGINSSENEPDSLGDNRLLLHFTEGDANGGLLFGISSVFRINSVLVAVTLPSCNRWGYSCVSWKYYQEFIREHQLCHNIHLVKITDDVPQIDLKPLSFQIVDEVPPYNTYCHILSPCPEVNPHIV